MSAPAAQPKLRTPQPLYEDWERSHWSAQEIDLSRDGDDWKRMEDGERTLLHWVLCSLMVAEERISTQFCGLVLAQDDEEEGSFLSTQLVDEVRHMQFYARFQNEVVADPAAIAAHVERARQVLGEPFKKVFDEALVDAHDRLRREPRNREAKVDFVTIYHMVIEGTLGITASHFLLDFLRERDLLPGFADGYGRIAADEQRHIAYGTAVPPASRRRGRRRWRTSCARASSTCCPRSRSRCLRRAKAHGTCSAWRTASWRSTA